MRMKIIYLGNYNQTEKLSGPEKVAKRLFLQSQASGIDSIFIEYFFKEYLDFSQFKRLFGYKIINENPRILRMGVLYALFYFLKNKPDVIHIVTYKRFIIIILLLKYLFVSKIVVTFHGIMKYEKNKSRKKQNKYGILKDMLLEKLFINKADLMVFLSENQLKLAKEYYNIPHNKIKILPNGIDEVFYNNNKSINCNDKFKIVFYNGFSHEVKGIKLLEIALSTLNESNFKLFVLGNKTLLKINKDIKIEYVPFLDSNAMSNFLLDKDIYINTAEYESFSLMAVETMAAGLIVIVSNRVGMQNYICNQQNGFVFNYDNPEQLSEILKCILNKQLDWDFISKNAAKIYEKLNWSEVMQMYLETYKDLLREKR